MQFDESDTALLWDMLQAARAVSDFVAGKTYEEFLGDELLKAAVERKVEIIGEAAGKVSAEAKRLLPQIPWKQTIGQRHILAHHYGKIRPDAIWKVTTMHVPELIQQLRAVLPPSSPS